LHALEQLVSLYRVWRVGDATTSAGKQLYNGFGLTSEQRRRRSIYLAPYNQAEEEHESALGEENTWDRQNSHRSFLTSAALCRPAVAHWLRRELQALLLQEDVDLLAQHILGNLKHGIEASAAENKRLKKPGPGRLKGEEAVEILTSTMLPYLPEYAKRLGQEFLGFLISGLNIDAHDAVVFRIEEAAAEEEDDSTDEAGEDEPPPGT
jgi:hypothetical protein